MTSVSRSLLKLALPVVAVNVGSVTMGVADTLIVGRVSAEALAAVAIANVYYFALSMFGVGVLLGLDPILSQAIGAGDEDTVIKAVQRGIVLAVLLTIPISLALGLTGPVLRMAHQPAEVVPLAHTYGLILIPGILPVLLFSVGRQFLQASHRVAPVLWTILLANLINIALNVVLIFGHFGLPALGVAGSAIATTISRTLMLCGLTFFAWSEFKQVIRPWRIRPTEFPPFIAILKLGLPIAGHIELEMGAFSAVALLMGTFGTIAVAGHQIAINIASTTFMVPMGVGTAASVLVGNSIGRGDVGSVRSIARSAMLIGAGFMTITGILLLAFPAFFARLYTSDSGVILMASSLLPLAGIFQIFDGIQVTCVGILRGLGDTRAPMLINLIGFGACGLGASFLLAYHTSLGAVGLWWGLVIGLIVVSIILYLRVEAMMKRPYRRIRMDDKR